MRTTLIIGLLLTALATTGAAQQARQDGPAFKHPRAVQAHNRYKFRMERAQQAFDREAAQARAEYLEGLRAAAEAVARTGNVDELKAIAEAQAAVEAATAAPADIAGTRWALSSSPRAWIEFMPDGTMRTFAGGDGGIWRCNGDGTVAVLYGAGLASEIQTFRIDGARAESAKPSQSPRSWSRAQR